MERHRARRTLAGVLASFIVLAGLFAARRHSAAEDHGPPVLSEREILDADIAFYEARIARDPRSAADMAQASGLYLQRSRLSGDPSDYARAEGAARRSIRTRGWRNDKAQLILASSLLSQHRFVEARLEAQRLVSLDPERASSRALLGEIEVELGDYDAARLTFESLMDDAGNLAVTPRLARWLEVTGQPERAHALLLRATREARRRPDLPREQVAWFELRVADLALRNGRLGEAERAIESGLRSNPADSRLLAARARLAAASENWAEVVRFGLEAEAGGADLATLSLIGDGYEGLGESTMAQLYWNKVERAHLLNPEPFARQWTQFRLDHGMRLQETRAVLEREIMVRRDVLGWDMLAWARYLTGDIEGAGHAIAQSLRTGTKDASVLYHAGLIAQAAGDSLTARLYRDSAFAMNRAYRPPRYLSPIAMATPMAAAPSANSVRNRGSRNASHRS